MSLLAKEVSLVLWTAVSSWYYGYHIAELNFPEASLTCSSPSYTSRSLSLHYPHSPPPHYPSTSSSPLGLPPCLDITSSRYSLITAIFTIGGLLGSISSTKILSHLTTFQAIALTGVINLVGSLGMFFSTHWVILVSSRFISGLAAGLAITIVSPLLSHISLTSPHPKVSSARGVIGTTNQLAIVLGIVSAQLVGLGVTGMKGDRRGGWRWVVGVSGLVAVVQLAAGWALKGWIEERKDLKAAGRPDIERRESGSDEPLLSPSTPTASKNPSQTLSIPALISNKSIRPKLFLVMFCLAIQQLSGINAVLYYSTTILKPIVPDHAGLIGIGIAVLNAVMTFPPMFLVDRVGRKPLLLLSVTGMIISSILLSFGMNNHHQLLSATTILTFVAAFAIGLGPIPFLLIAELVPPEAIPATSSLALCCSWVANFVVAMGFLPLTKALSYVKDGVKEGEGRVFWVFLGIQLVAGFVVVTRLYRS